MTRKHFAAIAAVIANAPMDRESLAHELASVLATTNPLFDRGRFIAACLVNEDDDA